MPDDEIPDKIDLILDGLTDAQVGQQLSLRWAQERIGNRVDVSAQHAVLTGEVDIDAASLAARWFGLEVRSAPREKVIYEYKSRFATALVFGLPALALHYIAPILAGGDTALRSMLYPRVIELILVGWMCVAVGWPILFQAALSLRCLRMTPDLFSGLIVVASLVTGNFHAGVYVLMLAVLQRWLAHRYADRTAGRADLLMPHFGRLAVLWLLGALLMRDLGFALLLPPMMALGGVNRRSPGASAALPVAGFAAVMALGPRALGLPVRGMEIEIGAGFQLMMVAVMALGWRGMSAKTQAI